MAGSFISLATLFLSSFHFVSAVQTAHARRSLGSGFSIQSHTVSGSLSAAQAGVGIGIGDSQDIEYLVNITLGGQEFTVVLDSGSTDLWVKSPVPLKITNDSGLATAVLYGEGGIAGPIQFAELKIGEYTIPSQAFINVNVSKDIDGLQGLLGIGMDLEILDSTQAAIKAAWGNDTTLGRSPLANIFNQNTSTKPVFDVSLGRSSDLDEFSDGVFVIGTHAPEYASVEQAPKLPQITEGRWSTVVDGLSVNGKNLTFTTKPELPTVPAGKLSAYMDTGTSFPEVPAEIANFIYGNIPGSVNSNGTWFVPCQSGANLTWYLGGQAFPMHTLDLTALQTVPWQPTPNSNVTIALCVGAYQTGTPPYPGIDMVLGDNFLRNVYMSFNFGDSPTRTLNGTGSFIQMLSLTNPDDAWLDFQVSRMAALSQVPNTVDPEVLAQFPGTLENFTVALGLAPPTPDSSGVSGSSASEETPAAAGALSDGAAASPSGSAGDSTTAAALLGKYAPVVVGLLAGNIVVMLLLCVITLVACMRRGGAKTRSLPANYAPVSFKDKGGDDPFASEPIRGYAEQ